MARVVVLGGSGVATPELALSLAHHPELAQSVELVLVGRSEHKLQRVAAMCARLVQGRSNLQVSYATDARAALEGAELVINQIRVGGLQARAFDETFPRDYGLPGEETVGPGGFANALRTIPVVLEYARLIEEAAPKATLLTFTNPNSYVQYAISRYTAVCAIGLCDSPVTLIRSIATLLGARAEELSVDYVGMHHYGWVTGVRWQRQDVMPQILSRAGEIPRLDTEPELIRAMGAIPHHYMKYIFHPDRLLAQQRGKPARAAQLLELQEEILAAYAGEAESVPEVLSKRGAVWYDAIIVPVMVALLENRPVRHIVNIPNGTALPWLPPGAIIEVPALLEEGRARPLPPLEVPAAVRALIAQNCAYEMLAVEAIVERSYGKALQALLLNPMGITYDQAAGILRRIWPSGYPADWGGRDD